MRYSTVSGLMVAAFIGDAVAGPVHALMHRHTHQKKDVDYASLDWSNMGVDWTSAWEAGQHSKTVAPVAAPTPAPVKPVAPPAPTYAAPAPAAPKAPSSSPADSVSDNSIVDDVKQLWKGLIGASNSRKTFGAVVPPSGSLGDHYRGNYGAPYGSNIIKVSSTSGHDFTNTFINTGSEIMTINIWNKIGSDLQDLSGSALAPHDTALTFVLRPGKSQIVAIGENSQIGWAQACGEVGPSGAFQTAWGEANFVPSGSGYDVSFIQNGGKNNYDMSISSQEVPCKSSMTENYWLTDTQPIGESDGSCYVPMSTMHLTTKMGGSVY